MLIEFKDCPEDACFIDLRTPGEHAEGTIGHAVNIPIFTDEERHNIGTIYKQDSIERAKSLAIQAASDKLPVMYKEIISLIDEKGAVILFCARGGMRSQTLGSLLNAMGYPVKVIKGGYKSYRRAVIEEIERLNGQMTYVVLHGHTGTGKTEILKRMEELAYPVLDIEGLARHRGSMLGKVGIKEQITQKQFEHEVYETLRRIESGFVFVEAESRRLGTLLVPQCIMDSMRKRGLHAFVGADLDFRADQIVKDYITKPEDVKEISDTLDHFVRFVGHKMVEELKGMLDQGEYHKVARILMTEYYDPKYAHREYHYAKRFHVKDVESAVQEISTWYDEAVKDKLFTLIVESDDLDAIEKAGDVAKNGGLVVFPTETVYGLGANALDPTAANRIYQAKGRPSDNPLIVHIHDIAQVKQLALEVSPLSQKLMEAFWPGPLTLIFKKTAVVPDNVTAGLDTVAVRMPDHAVAMDFLKAAGVPIAAPSANMSGKPSPTKAEHVIADLYGRVDVILCSDPSRIGVESTVVDATGDEIIILRPGGLTREMLESVAVGQGNVLLDPGISKEQSGTPRSPGMKYTHYAPKAPLFLIEESLRKVGGSSERACGTPMRMGSASRLEVLKEEVGKRLAAGTHVGVLTTEEHASVVEDAYASAVSSNALTVIRLGHQDDVEGMASNVFDCLRRFDGTVVEVILAEGCEENGLGEAVMNRLRKAAGGRIIEV